MKISTKGRYALRLIIDLAIHKDKGYVTLKEIAERQSISKKYLEQIVPMLNKTGILKTNRGYQGGYMLAKSADKYTVGEILRVTEGNLAPVSCLEHEENECPRAGECRTLFVWEGLHRAIYEYLDSITVQDIIDRTGNPDDYII
ncbi:MAG: Rrf2 family transcriptional regulator [Oscillospiraceae bacterium]|nr:Rrf2 family transcriptional regulator [Oscillospiraceae bacterium]